MNETVARNSPIEEEVDTWVDPLAGDLSISALASDELVTASLTTTIREASTIIGNAGVGLLLILDGEDLKGVVSERDIVRAVSNGTDLDGSVEAIVSTGGLCWAPPETKVGTVAREMMENYVRHVLVGQNGQCEGVISMRDLLLVIMD